MFNSVALDVAIGMVLVYLLYSLFVTLVGEIIATALGLRARMLRVAIERMLNDGDKWIVKTVAKQKSDNVAGTDDSKKQWQIDLVKVWWFFLRKIWPPFLAIVRRLFLKESRSFKNTLAGKFYDYPSIKYIGKVNDGQSLPWAKTKPAYISQANFAATIINLLSENGIGSSKMEQIRSTLRYNTLRIDPQTLKHFRNLFNASGDDLECFKRNVISWYNETMDRANGWYKQKLKLILFILGFIIAIGFNVDSIRIEKILSNDKDARTQLVTMGVAMARDSNKNKAYIHLGQDSIKKEAVIDSSLSHVSGDISKANMVLGLGWHFPPYAPDSIAIAKSVNCDYYAQISMDLDRLKDSIIRINAIITTNKTLLSVRENKAEGIRIDSAAKAKQAALITLTKEQRKELDDSRKKDSIYLSALNTLNTGLRKEINFQNNKLNGWIKDTEKDVRKVNDSAQTKFVHIFNIDYRSDGKNILITGDQHQSFGREFGTVWSSLFSLSFFGFLLTGLALSLGAPFWFGLLNKLVALRGSGVKPEEKNDALATTSTDATPETATSTNLLDTDLVATSAEELNFQYKNYPGVLNIYPGYFKKEDAIERIIEIHVISDDVLKALENIIGDSYNNVPISYLINSVINLHLKGGDPITNIVFPTEFGTFGCLAKNTTDNTKRYLMSCWHVLQKVDTKIVDGNGNSIATVTEGAVGSKIDVGFAEINVDDPLISFNGNLGIKHNFRAVSKNDALNTKVSFRGGFSGPVDNITICNDSLPTLNVRNKYTGQSVALTDLFSIAVLDEKNNPSSPSDGGDSGAIIIDITGTPLGLVVGGDLKYTYVVKLTNIFSSESNDNAYPNYYIPI